MDLRSPIWLCFVRAHRHWVGHQTLRLMFGAACLIPCMRQVSMDIQHAWRILLVILLPSTCNARRLQVASCNCQLLESRSRAGTLYDPASSTLDLLMSQFSLQQHAHGTRCESFVGSQHHLPSWPMLHGTTRPGNALQWLQIWIPVSIGMVYRVHSVLPDQSNLQFNLSADDSFMNHAAGRWLG